MSLKKFFLPLLIALTATSLFAADAEIVPQTRNVDMSLIAAPVPAEPQIPKRELKFDISEEEQPLTLDKVQEGMLDQRYVATFKLVFTKKEKPDEKTAETPTAGMMGGRSKSSSSINVIGMADYRTLDNTSRYFPMDGNSRIAIIDRLRNYEGYQSVMLWRQMQSFYKYPKEFHLISEMAPEVHRISKIMATDFASQNTPFFIEIKKIYEDTSGTIAFIEIKLLSTNPDEAKKWVEAWLTVYDWGLCYPAQKECLNVKQRLKQMLVENSDKLKKAETELSNAQQEADKYKEFDDIKPEALVTLTTQRRMLSVDLAGIRARINACQEMLAKESMTANRKDQVETTKVAAEIELRGLDAKQKEIDHIIQGAQSRQKILDNTRNLPRSIERLKETINNTQTAINGIEEYQIGFQPLPVEDSKVTIRRIKWISPAKADASK